MSHKGLGKHAALTWTAEEWGQFVDGARDSVDLFVAVTEAAAPGTKLVVVEATADVVATVEAEVADKPKPKKTKPKKSK